MPNSIAQWCWFAFFVIGTFGGWIFIAVLIWRMRTGEAYRGQDLAVQVRSLQTVNGTLGKTVRNLMDDLKKADAANARLQAECNMLAHEAGLTRYETADAVTATMGESNAKQD